MGAGVAASKEVLNSWKEIARYLNRGIRTVQRWERELNLPVRRLRTGRSPVLAERSALDLWVKNSQPGKPRSKRNGNSQSGFKPVTCSSLELYLTAQKLHEEATRSWNELRNTIQKLHATVGRISIVRPPPQMISQIHIAVI